jgi:protein NEDD1
MENIVASASDVIKTYRVPKLEAVVEFKKQHQSEINEVSWNHNNKLLATCSADGKIYLNRSDGASLGAFPDKDNCETNSLCFSTGSRYLATGGSDNLVKIWDLKKKSVVKLFKTHTDAITCIKFSRTDSHLASCTLNGELHVHNLLSGKTVAQYKLEDTAFKAIRYAPLKKNQFATCSDSGAVHIWDYTKKQPIGAFKGHTAPTSAIAYSPTLPTLLISAGLDKKIVLIDTVKQTASKVIQTEAPLTAMDLHDDGNTLVVGTASGKLLVYDIRNEVKAVSEVQAHNTIIRSIQLQHAEVKSELIKDDFIPTSPSAMSFNSALDDSADETFSRPGGMHDVGDVLSPLKGATPTRPEDVLSPIRPMANLDVNSSIDRSLHTPGGPNMSFDNGVLSPLSTKTGNNFSILSPIHHVTTSSPLVTANMGSPLTGDVLSPLGKDTYSNELYTNTNVISPITTGPSINKPTNADLFSTPIAKDKAAFSIEEPPISPIKIETPVYPKYTPSATIDLPPTGSFTNYQSSPSVEMTAPAATRKSVNLGQQKVNDVSTMQSIEASTMSMTAEAIKKPAPQLQPAHTSQNSGTNVEYASPPQNVNQAVQFQQQLLQGVISDSLASFREEVLGQVQNLHLELLRQFQIQQMEINTLMQHHYGEKQELLEEIKRLKEENRRLKDLY